MLTLDYTFASHKTQFMNDSETSCSALPSTCVTTDASIGTEGITTKNRAPAKLTSGITITPEDWEFLKSVLKSLKISMNVNPDKVSKQLFGYPDSDIMKLLDEKNDKLKGLSEEHLLELSRRIVGKNKNIWNLRGSLHQMIQKKGELVSSFTARLHSQARLCRYSMRCGANRGTYSNDFMDTIIMGKLVCGLMDHEIKTLVLNKLTEIEDSTALVKIIETKDEKCSSHVAADVNSGNKSDKWPQCCNFRMNHLRLKGWKEKCPAYYKECKNCGKSGHIRRMCQAKAKVMVLETEDMVDEQVVYTNNNATIATPGRETCEQWGLTPEKLLRTESEFTETELMSIHKQERVKQARCTHHQKTTQP